MSETATTKSAEQRCLPESERARNFLVVVDETPESKVAIRFAAGRAAHIKGGGLILFYCIRPGDFQHWIAVADRMREEAYEQAELLLSEVTERIYTYCGVTAEIIIVDGEPQEELKKFMDARNDIFNLLLGANSEGDPGPLVDYFSGPMVGSMQVPVTIVPGGMSFDTVDSMV